MEEPVKAWAILVCLTAFLAPIGSSALEFTESEIKSLAAGELVRKPLANSCKNGFYGGTGFAVVNASPKVIWRFLQDWSAYPEAFPRTVEAKELSRKGERSLIKMRLGYKILSIIYHLTVISDWDEMTMSFFLEKSRPHDLHATRGYWRLFPQDGGRTLVVYAVAVQVPAGIAAFLGEKVEKELERALVGLPKYVKRYLENPTGNKYRQLTTQAKHTTAK